LIASLGITNYREKVRRKEHFVDVDVDGTIKLNRIYLLYAFFCVILLRLKSDAGELYRRKHTAFRTRRMFELKDVPEYGQSILCLLDHAPS